MKATVLITDTPGAGGLLSEHGLSVYIHTVDGSVIFDSGQTGAFLTNAERLGIDLSFASSLVVSHGHYDHTGGVLPFAGKYPDIPVYIHHDAFGEFYHGEKYIGSDKKTGSLPCVRLTRGDLRISGNACIFSEFPEDICKKSNIFSDSSLQIKEKCGIIERYVEDGFSHEQYLAVFEGGRSLLLSGCAHRGIVNIIRLFIRKFGSAPSALIGGFHMNKNTPFTRSDEEFTENTAYELMKYDTVYYTGHCTGEYAYGIMKKIMGDRLNRLSVGGVISV